MDNTLTIMKEYGFPIAVCFYLLWTQTQYLAPMRDAMIRLVTLHEMRRNTDRRD